MKILDNLPGDRMMPDGHVEAMRHALVRAAADEPGRQRRLGDGRLRRLLVVTVTVTTAAGGSLVAFETFGGQGAYASWTAIPDRVDGAAVAILGAACHETLTKDFQRTDLPSGLTPALAEQRGKFTAVVLKTPGHLAVCVSGMSHGQLDGYIGLDSVAPGVALTLDAEPGVLTGSDASREVVGRVMDPQIAKVVVTTTDGRAVTASQADGLYLAWWPSGASAKAVTGYDGQGKALASFRPQPTDTRLSPEQR